MKNIITYITKLLIKLTNFGGNPKISRNRELTPSSIREPRLPDGQVKCPYCFSANYKKRGVRQKKLEQVQLYQCHDCQKTFTRQITKGKHYPLPIMFDAISIYNLGYSLEETCRIINKRNNYQLPITNYQSSSNDSISKQKENIENSKIENSLKIENCKLKIFLQPSTLSNWLSETGELCRFERMREYALKKYSPKEMVVSATLAHRQLYRYLFHRAKCDLIIREDIKHSRFGPLQEFLEMVPGECPHQYFQDGLRASEAPLTFSKTQMIVRAKQNYANKLAAFVLQSIKDNKQRHQALQKFMLANDSVTVATEVPVYLTRDDLEHMQTQLGFQIFSKEYSQAKNNQFSSTNLQSNSNNSISKQKKSIENCELKINELPKLITEHIDILQIRNGQIHILDYKPNAGKERPIEQLTLYAMALSRLTGLRLFEFKCAWFDEKDYFEFFPLHVLHKPKKGRRRRKVYTMEGVYKINQEDKKISSLQPINKTNYVIH